MSSIFLRNLQVFFEQYFKPLCSGFRCGSVKIGDPTSLVLRRIGLWRIGQARKNAEGDGDTNGAFGDCNILYGASMDLNNNVPDECENFSIAVASTRGLAAITMLLCVSATLLLRRRM